MKLQTRPTAFSLPLCCSVCSNLSSFLSVFSKCLYCKIPRLLQVTTAYNSVKKKSFVTLHFYFQFIKD